MIIAAATGIVGASVTILGIMAAHMMNRSGYDVRLAAGTITLVTMGLKGNFSSVFPYAGVLIPVFWIAVMYAIYSWTRAVRSVGFYYCDLWYEFFRGLMPPTTLIAFALGAILAGWATPAEAAACGAFGAILLSLAYRKLTGPSFYDAMIKALEITVLIMFLVAASNFFGAVFSRLGTPTMLTELLLAWDLSATAVLIIIMVLVFLLGWPLEWVPIVLIIAPILAPTLEALDGNLTWFAILVAVNLQTARLSPPVALSACFLNGVVPEWDLKDIYFGMMQFLLIQLLGLILFFIPSDRAVAAELHLWPIGRSAAFARKIARSAGVGSKTGACCASKTTFRF